MKVKVIPRKVVVFKSRYNLCSYRGEVATKGPPTVALGKIRASEVQVTIDKR